MRLPSFARRGQLRLFLMRRRRGRAGAGARTWFDVIDETGLVTCELVEPLRR
jgi:hypothetical protein